jgi:hypothetical protein
MRNYIELIYRQYTLNLNIPPGTTATYQLFAREEDLLEFENWLVNVAYAARQPQSVSVVDTPAFFKLSEKKLSRLFMFLCTQIGDLNDRFEAEFDAETYPFPMPQDPKSKILVWETPRKDEPQRFVLVPIEDIAPSQQPPGLLT